MAGPQTPYGYDPIFHDILASIHINKPAQIHLDDSRNPKHLRALFHQFKTSWDKQAQVHHKRKEFQEEKACRQNYYVLQQYECQLSATGITLTARSQRQASLRFEGTAKLIMPFEKEEIPVDTKMKFHIDMKEQEELVRRMFGKEFEAERQAAKSTAKYIEQWKAERFEASPHSSSDSAPVIPHNLPPATPSAKPDRPSPSASQKNEYAFLLSAGRPPASPKELSLFIKDGILPKD